MALLMPHHYPEYVTTCGAAQMRHCASTMKRNRVLRVRLTADEMRRIDELRGEKTLSDYIRELIEADGQKDAAEAKSFQELLAKISRIETEPLFAKLSSIESLINSFAATRIDQPEPTHHPGSQSREVIEKISYLERLVGQVRGDTVSILTLVKQKEK